jgi:hypothetical protein
MDDIGRAVASRGALARIGRHRQALVLVVLMAVAFGSAIYLGVRHPHRAQPVPRSVQLTTLLTPLAPQGAVPAATRDPLYAAAHAAGYRTGEAGITLPVPRRTAHFTTEQVSRALTLTREYLIASSLDVAALTGVDADESVVRRLLGPVETRQFDRSLDDPADDGRFAATGWVVRFDPATVALADPAVRVHGTVAVAERDADRLEVATDHTLVYTVRSATSTARPASLFTVRRQLRLYFTREDLVDQQVEVARAAVEAGPLDCSADPAAYFHPLLAGQVAADGAGTDPYDHSQAITAACGLLRTPATPHATPHASAHPAAHASAHPSSHAVAHAGPHASAGAR